MKVAINKERSGWIIDQIVDDYCKHTRHQIVGLKDNPDVFWVANSFALPSLLPRIPNGCKTIVQLHHFVKEKLQNYPFNHYNKCFGLLVPNKITQHDIVRHIFQPVSRLPYWVLSSRMKPVNQQKVTELKAQVEDDEILIGSFQKDTEKNGGPKLEKGPDVFLNVITELNKTHNIRVILSGYRRGYLTRNFDQRGVKYSYFEQYRDINDLYDLVDWCFVTSRVEGGPQAVLEASFRKTKVLSTKVGIAPEVLHPECLCDSVEEFCKKFAQDLDRIDYNYNNVAKNYVPEVVIPCYDDFWEKVCNPK